MNRDPADSLLGIDCPSGSSSSSLARDEKAAERSRAGRRVVGVPQAIIPVLREHLSVFVADEPGALVFPGAKGGPRGMRLLPEAKNGQQSFVDAP